MAKFRLPPKEIPPLEIILSATLWFTVKFMIELLERLNEERLIVAVETPLPGERIPPSAMVTFPSVPDPARVAPDCTVRELAGIEPETRSVPADTRVFPEKLLAAERVAVPLPILVRPPVPLIEPLRSVLAAPSMMSLFPALVILPETTNPPVPAWNVCSAPRVWFNATVWLVDAPLTMPPDPLVMALPVRVFVPTPELKVTPSRLVTCELFVTEPEVPWSKTSVEPFVIPMELRLPDPLVQTFVARADTATLNAPVESVNVQLVFAPLA